MGTGRVKYLLSLLICAAVASSLSASDEKEFGRVIFISESAGEVMIISSDDNPSLIAGKGSILTIGKGSAEVRVSVTDICGLYVRCSFAESGGAASAVIKEGDIVFYSEIVNRGVKYSDVKRVLASLLKLYEDFIFRIESADEPEVISQYVEQFSSDLEKMIPQMERMNRLYPELKKFYTDPPAELKYESETLKVLEPALANAFFKIKLYSENPAVKISIEKLEKVLGRMKGAAR